MAEKQSQKVKGCRKCGRSKKRKERSGSPLSLFVRGKIDGKDYFKLTGQAFKG